MSSIKITLTAIDPLTGAATITMNRDNAGNVVQKTTSLNITGSVQDFIDSGKAYAVAYYAGIDSEAAKVPVVPAAITALVGQSTTVQV